MAEHSEAAGEQKHRAGLFDIRFIIAALIGLYGAILEDWLGELPLGTLYVAMGVIAAIEGSWRRRMHAYPPGSERVCCTDRGLPDRLGPRVLAGRMFTWLADIPRSSRTMWSGSLETVFRVRRWSRSRPISGFTRSRCRSGCVKLMSRTASSLA